jgi:5-methylcytosine-specific restriction protein A
LPLEPKRHCGKPGHRAYLGRRCPSCEKERNQQRGSASSRGYDVEWRKCREEFLKLNPICEISNCDEKATDVDHIVGLREGGAKLDFNNLRAFCHRHHSQRTGRDQVKVGRK